MNPLNSPWNKPKFQTINDKLLYFRWSAIKKHLQKHHTVTEYQGVLAVTVDLVDFYIAKNSPKMRLKSHLDWSWYTPKTLAQAMDTGTVDVYYEYMLKDCRSDPNLWRDHDEEMILKSYYAAREGRATEI
jgi:hypothetical protein